MTGSTHEREGEYDGTGTGHAPYGEAAYHGRGQAGDEVAAALEADLAEEYGSDDAAAEHLSSRMQRAEGRGDGVPRLSEEDGGTNTVSDDMFAECSPGGIDGDRHELSAEEAAMHYVDGDDRIPE